MSQNNGRFHGVGDHDHGKRTARSDPGRSQTLPDKGTNFTRTEKKSQKGRSLTSENGQIDASRARFSFHVKGKGEPGSDQIPGIPFLLHQQSGQPLPQILVRGLLNLITAQVVSDSPVQTHFMHGASFKN